MRKKRSFRGGRMVIIWARGGAPVGILLIRPGVGSGTGGGGCAQPQLAARVCLCRVDILARKGLTNYKGIPDESRP